MSAPTAHQHECGTGNLKNSVITGNEGQWAKPRVSIGLPVYNGEKYLAETLDSLLDQTYADFEIVISDNASTDKTGAICQEYAQRDKRIKYQRNQVNQGAADNYNIVFHLAEGEYFKWAAADDLLAPKFLERCVKVLDDDPGVVLCYTRTAEIDACGNVLRVFPAKPDSGAEEVGDRFFEIVCRSMPVVSIFGLVRTNVLQQTMLIGKYSGSDRPLLGELCLHGRFHEVPETLFHYRRHDQQSWGDNKSHHEQQAWYDPSRAGKITFPHWRLLAEHFRSIHRAPISFADKLQCYGCMARWMRRRWRYLANNLILRDVVQTS
jgi:glycosyltransferase involved in cell wall biosynthesis